MTEKQEATFFNSPIKDGEKRPIDEIMTDLQDKRPFFESIIIKALKGPLAKNELDEVSALLRICDPKLVHHCGLTPEKLPELVNNNPLIAALVLVKLTNHPKVADYYTVFLKMNMSRESLDVITWLSQAIELPIEFVHLYLSGCIVPCQNIRDKYIQKRVVRLMYLFMRTLIRNKFIDIQEVFRDVDTTGIRDVATLISSLLEKKK